MTTIQTTKLSGVNPMAYLAEVPERVVWNWPLVAQMTIAAAA